MYKGMYVYPWDLAEEGIDVVVDRLLEAGINTVNVTASYHAGKFLRPHAPRRRVMFPDDGTVYFRPSPARYRDTPLRPLMNALVEEHDIFGSLADRCAGRELEVGAWVVGLHNSRLGLAHPQHVVRNVFGDAYPYSLCPSHPEVRAYLLALLADVAATCRVRRLVLEAPGFLPYHHGYHHEVSLVPPNPWTSALLALCFCPACLRRAAADGIDGQRVGAAVRGALDAFYAAPGLPDPSDRQAVQWVVADLLEDPEMAAYLRTRLATVTSLLGACRSVLPASVSLSVLPSLNPPTAQGWLEGASLSSLAAQAHAVEVLAYRMTPAEVGADVWWVRRRIGTTSLHVVFRPSYPDSPDEASFAASVRAAREHGAEGIAFYNYGHIRLGHLAWIRRALTALDT